jgi:hypothetical protein
MQVLSALLYLRVTSLKNFFRAQARRLRQPKYLAGAVFVVAYFWFFVFRHTNAALQTMNLPGSAGLGALVLAFGSLAVTGILGAMWTLTSDQPGLQFTEAEIAFLFPAPLTRRTLIHFKLLSTLFGSLIQAVFFSLIFNRGGLFNVRAPQLLVGWWVLLSIISLHLLGASLTIARLAEGGLRAGRRRALILAGLGALGLFTGWWIWHDMPGVADYSSIFEWAAAVLNGGALRWLLWPARQLLQPFVATGLSASLLAFAPAGLVLIAHYWWVGRMDVAFEEASIARAAHFAARRAEMQARGTVHFGAKPTKGRRPPFEVGRTRWVELAFLWKNLLSTRPWFTVRNWLICAAAIIALWRGFSLWLGHSYWMFGGGLATVGMVGGLMAMVYGPLITRLDIRQDLANADILKTYPLPGWRIVLGEMLTPVAILSGIGWLALLAWYLGLNGHQPPSLSLRWFSPAMRTVFTCCCAGVMPFLITLLLLVPNGAAILFPAVFRTMRTPGAGLDLMGQRMIFGFGQIFVLLLVLLPGAGAAGLLIFMTQWLIGPAAAEILAAVSAALVLAGEIWCVLWWLGDRFEKLDLSSELRP